MKIREIKLNVLSDQKAYAARVALQSGANLIRAENTSGKSTLMQSIFFALGLERSFGASVDIPLPYAMRERIQPNIDAEPEPVIASSVELELVNSKGRTIRVIRHIKGGSDPKLVRVEETDKSGATSKQDFFLHDPGAAQREAGFHNFLAKFIGFGLPTVPTYDGGEAPLYLECLLPMFFIEQKRGWSILQGPFPTHIRIQDMARRVMEFILKLDVGDNRIKRSDFRRLITTEERAWENTYKQLQDRVGTLIRVSGLPRHPNAEFSQNGLTSIEVYYDGEWISLEHAQGLLAKLVNDLREKEIRPVEDVAPLLEQRLSDLLDEQEKLEALLISLRNEYQSVLTEQRAIDTRLSALKSDLRKNQDAEKLESLGSDLGSIIELKQCPTCHQGVTTELLPSTSSPTMSIGENITFIRNQVKLYQALEEETKIKTQQVQLRYSALESDIRDKRSEIRSLRNDLSRASTSVSRSEIESIVRLENRIASWESASDEFQLLIDDLRNIASRHAILNSELRSLASSRLSIRDRRKIDKIESQMREYLKDFHFKSFKYDEVTISRDTLRPQVYVKDKDGELYEKDIGFDASASDAIRLKWAYYLAIMSTLNEEGGNNFGFLVIDEPGQQSIDADDLIKFIDLSAKVSSGGSQIIISSSESKTNIESKAKLDDINYLNFDGYILTPII